jgi:CubicO group peptidase (beta-lactamase class C family)
MSIRLASLLVAVSLAPTLMHAQALPPVAVAHRLADSLARDFVARGESPSVAIAVIRGTDTIAFLAHGMADLEHQVPATTASVYRIGSVTKQFTAAAVLQLADQGKLSLDDAIATHLADLPAAWRAVTVRQLLNHTSGIPSYTSLGPEWQRRWGEAMLPRAIVAMTADRPMDFAPGSAYRYNNTGYVLLGMLIEHLTDRRWGMDLEERFTRPLGLADTRNCLTMPLVPRRVHGYEKAGAGWRNADHIAMSQPYSAGAMCSSLGDLHRWNRALHGGAVVPEAWYRQMITPTGAAAAGDGRYGFGLSLGQVEGDTVITHGGGIHGFITANAWVPRAELSVTVLTNSGSAKADDLGRQLVRVALGYSLMTRPAAVALADADRARYVGVYALQLPPGPRDFTVAVGPDGGLTGQMAGQGANPLIHFGDHTFGVAFDPTVRIIFTMVDGRATSMILRQRGGEIRGPRKP